MRENKKRVDTREREREGIEESTRIMRLSVGGNYFDYANSPLSFFSSIFSYFVIRFSKDVFAIFYRRRFILLRELRKDCSSVGLWKTFSPLYLLTEKVCT
jgi:hypothetical protein